MSAGLTINASLKLFIIFYFLGLILIFVLSILDVDVCSVLCEALLLFFATLKLIVQLCTHSVVIIAMIAVEIARIISTHCSLVIFMFRII
nr:MAG TPA: hypothetical protein [Microviridae sp.]